MGKIAILNGKKHLVQPACSHLIESQDSVLQNGAVRRPELILLGLKREGMSKPPNLRLYWEMKDPLAQTFLGFVRREGCVFQC